MKWAIRITSGILIAPGLIVDLVFMYGVTSKDDSVFNYLKVWLDNLPTALEVLLGISMLLGALPCVVIYLICLLGSVFLIVWSVSNIGWMILRAPFTGTLKWPDL